MALSAGTRLGPYEVLAPLRAGGMGEVYRARDTRLGREAALKVLPDAVAGDPERRARFEQEASAASALNHPAIVTVYDVGSESGTLYVAMELVDGQTARDLLAAGALPLQRLLEIAASLADGLAKAHESGIVHRDLKPENLMVSADGHAKILDFGLAKLTQPEASEAVSELTTLEGRTAPGTVLGTVGYMSPEQARGEPVDFRSDQFSFGAILYELATGRRAFKRDSTPETLAAIVRDEPEPLESLRPGTPAPLRWVVERCLAKDRRERYAATRDLARDLARLSRGLSEASTGTTRLAPPPSRRRWPLLVAPASLLLGLLLGFVATRRAPAPPPLWQQVTFRKGSISRARFAPDGATVVYAASWSNEPVRLYSTRTDDPESATLPLEPGTNLLAIGGAGKMAVALEHGPGNVLAEVPPGGGAPRELLENIRDAEWAPDGSALAIVRRHGDSRWVEFPPGKPLYKGGANVLINSPRFSPAGDRIAFIEGPDTGGRAVGPGGLWSVVVVDLAGRARALSQGWGDLIGLAWNARTREIWFTAREAKGRSGGLELHAVDLSGRHRLVQRAPGILRIEDVAADGRVLLIRQDWPLTVTCLPPGEKTERDLTWLDFSEGTDLSEDGRTLLVTEAGLGAGATGAVYVRKTDGSPAARLGDGLALALSRDQKWAITIPTASEAPDRLVLVPTGAGESRTLASPGLRYEAAEFSPDGKRIAFKARVGAEARLYVQDLDGGPPQPLLAATDLDLGPFSPDGRWVSAIDPSGAFNHPVDGGKAQPLSGVSLDDVILRWDASGRELFVARPGIPARIDRLDPATGRRTPLRSLGPSDTAGVDGLERIVVTPDGRSYCYTFLRNLGTLFVVTGLR